MDIDLSMYHELRFKVYTIECIEKMMTDNLGIMKAIRILFHRLLKENDWGDLNLYNTYFSRGTLFDVGRAQNYGIPVDRRNAICILFCEEEPLEIYFRFMVRDLAIKISQYVGTTKNVVDLNVIRSFGLFGCAAVNIQEERNFIDEVFLYVSFINFLINDSNVNDNIKFSGFIFKLLEDARPKFNVNELVLLFGNNDMRKEYMAYTLSK